MATGTPVAAGAAAAAAAAPAAAPEASSSWMPQLTVRNGLIASAAIAAGVFAADKYGIVDAQPLINRVTQLFSPVINGLKQGYAMAMAKPAYAALAGGIAAFAIYSYFFKGASAQPAAPAGNDDETKLAAAVTTAGEAVATASKDLAESKEAAGSAEYRRLDGLVAAAEIKHAQAAAELKAFRDAKQAPAQAPTPTV